MFYAIWGWSDGYGTPTNGLDLTGAPDFTNNTTNPYFAGKYIQNVSFAISADNLYLYAIFFSRNIPPPWEYFTPGVKRVFRYDIANDIWTIKTPIDNFRMAIAVCPDNNQLVLVGDVYLHRSNNSGNSWINIGSGIHDDIHEIKFSPYDPYTLFVGCDGGVWKCVLNPNGTMNTVTELNNGLGVATLYNTTSSVFDPYQILIGNQDLGLNYLKNSNWSHEVTSDGFAVLMDYNNIDIMYGTTYHPVNGKIQRSLVSANNPSFNCCYNISSEPAFHSPPLLMDPFDSKVLYQGRIKLWKTNNATSSTVTWSTIADFQAAPHNASLYQVVNELAIAPQNSNYMYASIVPDLWASGTFYRLFKTQTRGPTPTDWSEITPTPGNNFPISGIAVSDKDVNHVWVTYSGYTNNVKVKESFDGGQNWTDVNNGLPNLPVNCIIYEKGSNDGIYIGTDVGVYYKNADMNSWAPFMTNLPNTVVSSFDINYTLNKIRAATYGRGLWESDLACPGPYLSLTGVIPSSFKEAEVVDISDGLVNSNNSVYVRGTDEINVISTNGAVTFSSGSNVHLFIHNCEMPGNSWRGYSSQLPHEPELLSIHPTNPVLRKTFLVF